MKPANTVKGTVTEFTLPAPQLGRDKTIWAYLPYNYGSDDAAKRFPVIYMHDGQHVFDQAESTKREWHIEEKLNSLSAEAIIIGIEHGGTNRRIDEMTPYSNETHGGGHADDYLDFIVNTLKPHTDAHYRTMPGRQHTTIFGSSVGGLISLYALLRFQDIFGNAGVFSPSLWFSHEIFVLLQEIEAIQGRIYFMAGDHESRVMVPDLEHMEKLVLARVKDRNQVHKKIVPGGHHNEKLWRREFTDAYLWLMET